MKALVGSINQRIADEQKKNSSGVGKLQEMVADHQERI